MDNVIGRISRLTYNAIGGTCSIELGQVICACSQLVTILSTHYVSDFINEFECIVFFTDSEHLLGNLKSDSTAVTT